MKPEKRPPPLLAEVGSVAGRRDVVLVAPLSLKAWGWLPRCAPVGAVIEGPTGERVRVNEGGIVSEILPGGHPHGGAASEPTNARSA